MYSELNKMKVCRLCKENESRTLLRKKSKLQALDEVVIISGKKFMMCEILLEKNK